MNRQLPLIVYSLFLLILLLFDLGFSLRLLSSWPIFIGLWLGTQFVWLDHLVYLYLHPQEQLNQDLMKQLKELKFEKGQRKTQAKVFLNQLRPAWQTLRTRGHEQTTLSTQNILFAAAWVPLAFFGLTSTTSWLGKGLVLGIGWQLSWRMLRSMFHLEAKKSPVPTNRIKHYVLNSDLDREHAASSLNWLFWPIKRPVSQTEQLWVARGFLAAFTIITLLI